MKLQLTPTLDEFSQLAKRGNVIPVFAEFVADGETPVSAFKKLGRGNYSFLFESTEKNDVSGRFSFAGFEPRMVIQSYGREIRVVEGGDERRFETATDPLDEVRNLMAARSVFSDTKQSVSLNRKCQWHIGTISIYPRCFSC